MDFQQILIHILDLHYYYAYYAETDYRSLAFDGLVCLKRLH